MAVLRGFILIAQSNYVIYVNGNKYGLNNEEEIDGPTGAAKDNFVEVDIREEEIQHLKLHDAYRIVSIFEIGNESTAIVLEHNQNR